LRIENGKKLRMGNW